MAVPSAITDLSTTVASNSPAGSESPSLIDDYLRAQAGFLAQMYSGNAPLLSSVAGTDTITGTVTPTPTAYAAGQVFRFISAGANTTTAVTLNVSGLGAKNVTRNGNTALSVGDIPSGAVVMVVYDGTQFQLINTSKIPDGSVTTSKVVDANVTPSKLSTGAPTWDTLGNIGVGTPISSWGSTRRALEIGNAGFVMSNSSVAYGFNCGSNAYLNGSGNWIYKYSDYATWYNQAAGIHNWYIAASGTAGATISFTQAMVLSAAGQHQTLTTGGGSLMDSYGCRAWVNFNGTGTVAIRASGNVSSITDNGVGDYTVNLTNAMPDANFSAVASMNASSSGTDARVLTFSTTSLKVITVNASVQVDADPVCVAVFR